MRPSDKVIVKEFFDNGYYDLETATKDYKEEQGDEFDINNPFEDSLFIDWCTSLNEYEDYRYGDFESNNYPMWHVVFKCDRFYIDSDYCDVDKLYKLGIGVIDSEYGYYLFISGAGYSFYDAHWIPLFKMLGWIEYEESK